MDRSDMLENIEMTKRQEHESSTTKMDLSQTKKLSRFSANFHLIYSSNTYQTITVCYRINFDTPLKSLIFSRFRWGNFGIVIARYK